MKITIDTDVNAPGCPCQIVNDEDRRTILVQTDWDYPGFASTFGWNIAEVQREPEDDEPPTYCEHTGTDGTIRCHDCGMTAGEFIAAAYDFLTDNDGLTVEDPGYFS